MDMDGNHIGNGRAFYSIDEVQYAYDLGQVKLHSKIKFKAETYYDTDGKRMETPVTRIIDTTAGRVIFNNILPPEMQFKNTALDKGAIKDLIAEIYQVCDQEVTTEVADSIKDIGFEYAMRSGSTIAVSDITIPAAKDAMLAEADTEVEVINKQWRRGLLTEQERNDPHDRSLAGHHGKIAKEVRDTNGSAGKHRQQGELRGNKGWLVSAPIAQLAGYAWSDGKIRPAGIIRLRIKSNFR